MTMPAGLIGYLTDDGKMHLIGRVYGAEPDELYVALEPACSWAAQDWNRRLADPETVDLLRAEAS